MDGFLSTLRSTVILGGRNSFTAISAIDNGHLVDLVEDLALNKFFKRLAQSLSIVAHDGAKQKCHNVPGLVELMNAKQMHKGQAVCGVYIT